MPSFQWAVSEYMRVVVLLWYKVLDVPIMIHYKFLSRPRIQYSILALFQFTESLWSLACGHFLTKVNYSLWDRPAAWINRLRHWHLDSLFDPGRCRSSGLSLLDKHHRSSPPYVAMLSQIGGWTICPDNDLFTGQLSTQVNKLGQWRMLMGVSVVQTPTIICLIV